MKFKIFAVPRHRPQTNVILLIIRLIVGIAFIFHGSGKIQNPVHWMGNDAIFPPVLQGLAAISEFGGGIALILGIVTRLAALGIGFTMLFATYMHMFIIGDPFVNMTGGGGSYELALVFFGIAVLLLVVGPGKYSLDKVIFGMKN